MEVEYRDSHCESENVVSMYEGSEGRKHSRRAKVNNDTHFRLLFSKESVGRVIGKNGENLKKCRTALSPGAFVRVPECPPSTTCQDRILMVSCQSDDVPTIIRLIAPSIFSGLEGSENELLLLVPTDQAGSLIGSGGATIDMLRRSSGCKVKMFKDKLPFSDERVFCIPGNTDMLDNMITALLDALKLLKTHPLNHEIIHYNPVIICEENFVNRDCGGYTKARVDIDSIMRDGDKRRVVLDDSNYSHHSNNQLQNQQWNSMINSVQQMTGLSVNTKNYSDIPGYANNGYNNTGYTNTAAAMMDTTPYPSMSGTYTSPQIPPSYIEKTLPDIRGSGGDYNMYSTTPRGDQSRDHRDRSHHGDARPHQDDRRDEASYRDGRDIRVFRDWDFRDEHTRGGDGYRSKHRTRSRSPARLHNIEDEFMNEDISKELMIDDALTSYIIGPRGARIRHVREQTTAIIKIDDDNKVVDRKRNIMIKGKVKDVMWTFQKLKQLIQEAKEDAGPGYAEHGKSYQQPMCRSIDSELFRRAQQYSPYTPSNNTSTATETVNISVSNKNIGSIIGVKANVIKEIRNISNCKITIAKDTEVLEDDLRPIEITGTPGDIHFAEYLIQTVQQIPKDFSLSRR